MRNSGFGSGENKMSKKYDKTNIVLIVILFFVIGIVVGEIGMNIVHHSFKQEQIIKKVFINDCCIVNCPIYCTTEEYDRLIGGNFIPRESYVN